MDVNNDVKGVEVKNGNFNFDNSGFTQLVLERSTNFTSLLSGVPTADSSQKATAIASNRWTLEELASIQLPLRSSSSA